MLGFGFWFKTKSGGLFMAQGFVTVSSHKQSFSLDRMVARGTEKLDLKAVGFATLRQTTKLAKSLAW